jgi:hypothetical protein
MATRQQRVHHPALGIELNKERVIGVKRLRQRDRIPAALDLDLEGHELALSFAYSDGCVYVLAHPGLPCIAASNVPQLGESLI